MGRFPETCNDGVAPVSVTVYLQKLIRVFTTRFEFLVQ